MTTVETPVKSRRGWFVAAALVALLIVVLVVRWVSSNLTVGNSVEARSCHGGYCLEVVHRPDSGLLVARDEIRINHDGSPRYLYAANPFPGDEVSIRWADGGVSVRVADAGPVLTWDSATLASLDD
ncbi:hypothetical protein [Cryptosporangium phraense]|uniref:Uncharacterized protein n=1 Tax=Cryptosporangium phraense TaxID=2593070 RepID=A0A545AZS7_9ACTN|nr:hypothetical protein [Cryptosporangium phraense]TQS46105.1 hypothetical protein FL583_06380 [Cryptosporangium phraense]